MSEPEPTASAVEQPFTETLPDSPAPTARISVTCHENEVPLFVAAELERLYGNFYTSMVQWQTAGALGTGINTYVVRSGGDITTLLLFRRENRQVGVLNECIAISGDELQRFASYIFSRYPMVNVVSFHAVRPQTDRLAFPYQRFNCLEDIVLKLPESDAAYLNMLGSATRNYVKRYMNKARRSFPSFLHEVHIADAIDEQHVRDIVALNRARMTAKGKVPGIGAKDLQPIVSLVKGCGLLSVVMIDGRVAAGTINYRVGRNYFLKVIAHDPRYDEYRLGTLCCYLTICACIARGGDKYHFLWGKNEYKYRLGGVERALDHLAIYRSAGSLFLNSHIVLTNEARRCARMVQLWLHEVQRRNDLLSRSVVKLLRFLRAGRRA